MHAPSPQSEKLRRLTRAAALAVGVVVLLTATALSAAEPELMLAKPYRQGVEVGDYWVSEKLDGVRARWDGRRLLSRGGNVFAAPAWFSAGFPAEALDGELWIGRGRYEDVVSVVRRQRPHDGWREVKFMLFDLPAHGGPFNERVAAMRKLAATVGSPYLDVIEQFRVADHAELLTRLQQVIAAGGEGLMLHHQDARYAGGRSDALLKLKQTADAEAVVLGYRPGKGKYQGMTGSLKVRNADGKVFHVGSGLSDAQRRDPPPVGAVITYRHQGFTKNGLPRFPVFLRVRDEQPGPSAAE